MMQGNADHADHAKCAASSLGEPVQSGEALSFGDLRHNTGFLLRMAWLQVSERLEERSASVPLTAAEYTILRMIAQSPGVRQGHLAQALYIKPAAMTRIIRAFEDRALVAREIPDGDRRTVCLSIRPAGRAAIDRARALFGGLAEHERGQLDAQEQQQLNQLLRRFCGLEDSDSELP
ncbi:MAG: MarR family transcriptional regulator [Rhodobacteraceae bacterium]|nr:MAG: MarR family transcriptional regulator [Paracoccaceae bacterium]